MKRRRDDIEVVLKEFFGYGSFRPGQRQVIEALLNDQSVLAVFPTGQGKSLCYQLPAVFQEGLVVVISPLLALMKDQVDQLNGRSIPATRLFSDQTPEETERILEGLRTNHFKLLYLSPERFCEPGMQDFLAERAIQLLAIDEAHCISEWGHQFRPDYLKIARISQKIGIGRVLALTATATPKVVKEIAREFQIRPEAQFSEPLYRPNLQFLVESCPADAREARLLEWIKRGERGSTIVYVTRRETSERLATLLAKEGLAAKSYHAGLTTELRSSVQEGFMTGEVVIVVATIAFAMGIDKNDVRYIYHFNLPKSLEGYIQETGRAGRDGKAAECRLLACADDVVVLENFVYGDVPSEKSLSVLLDFLLRQGEVFDVSPFEIAHSFDVRSQTIDVILALLETQNVIVFHKSFQQHARFQFLRPLRIVLAEASEDKEVLESLLMHCQVWRSWYRIDLVAVSKELKIDRELIDRLLRELELADDIRISRWGVRKQFERCPLCSEQRRQIRRHMIDFFARRADTDLSRINQVTKFVTANECLSQHLSKHFGQEMDGPCGLCSSCLEGLGKRNTELPEPEASEMSEAVRLEIKAIKKEGHPALRTTHQLARYLCGITSPATSRAKLTQRASFGCLNETRYSTVIEQLEEMI